MRGPAPKARSKPLRVEVRPAAPARRAEPWHSVSIVSSVTTCKAALQCRGKRYLSREAPRLPLTDCDRTEACRCIYRHHSDRRMGPRRASESGGPATRTAPVQNLRQQRGRRKTDV